MGHSPEGVAGEAAGILRRSPTTRSQKVGPCLKTAPTPSSLPSSVPPAPSAGR
jgi:hypothetical protein